MNSARTSDIVTPALAQAALKSLRTVSETKALIATVFSSISSNTF